MQLLALPQEQLKERIRSDAAFSGRFHRALTMLLSHRCRDQLMSYGLASRAAANEAIDFETLDDDTKSLVDMGVVSGGTIVIDEVST